MSEPRVLPDRQGYWQARTKLGNEIVLRVIGGGGCPAAYIDLRGNQQRPEDFNGEWLAPVPSREAVEAAVAAMRSAAFTLEAYGDHKKRLEDAIAGLTGKGGA